MKKRRTVERWLAEIMPSPHLVRKADMKDREIDKKVGAQIKADQSKVRPPGCDWRRLMKTQ